MDKCYNSTVVNASIEQVWDTIKDFHAVAWADQVVSKLDKVGDKAGTEVGAKRVLNDAFQETLLSVDGENYAFTYSIDDGPGPVSKDVVTNYVGAVALRPVTSSGRTFIEWVATYETDSAEAVAEFCNPLYAALLASLKSKF